MADTTTTLPSTPPDSNTTAPGPATPAPIDIPPPTHHEIPTTEPSTPEQPGQPDPQIAILQKQIASLQTLASQTVAFFNNRIDSATGRGDDPNRQCLDEFRWTNIYTGTIEWAAGTTLDDLITYSYYLGCSLGNDWKYQQILSRDDNGNFSTVYKFVPYDPSAASFPDLDFKRTGTISKATRDKWRQACAFVNAQAKRFSSPVTFKTSDCTMDPSAGIFKTLGH